MSHPRDEYSDTTHLNAAEFPDGNPHALTVRDTILDDSPAMNEGIIQNAPAMRDTAVHDYPATRDTVPHDCLAMRDTLFHNSSAMIDTISPDPFAMRDTIFCSSSAMIHTILQDPVAMKDTVVHDSYLVEERETETDSVEGPMFMLDLSGGTENGGREREGGAADVPNGTVAGNNGRRRVANVVARALPLLQLSSLPHGVC